MNRKQPHFWMAATVLLLCSCGSDTATRDLTNSPQMTLEASIATPANGHSATQQALLAFNATAQLSSGSTVETSQVEWISDRDGVIGNGFSFMRSGFSSGTHTIVFNVLTKDGLGASDTVQLTIEAPIDGRQVIIDSPAGIHVSQHQLVELSGRGLTANSPETIHITWTSDIDQVLGNGSRITPGGLTPGRHRITLEAAFGDSATPVIRTAEVTLICEAVPSAGIAISILTPVNGAVFPQHQEITFRGSATDAAGTPLTGNQLVWTSSMDVARNPIGIGEACIVPDMPPGLHRVTVRVRDSAGQESSQSITLQIIP